MISARRALALTTLSIAVSSSSVVACDDDAVRAPDEPRAEVAPASSGERVPEPAAPSELTEEERANEALLARTRAAAKQLGQTLKQRLLEAVAEGGPPAAVEVCATEAPEIAARITRETGVHVGRSSLRLRNPANEGPAWVAAWLTAQGERPAEGAEGFARVEDGEAHVLAPIPVEGVCLTCHGSDNAIAPAVREALRARYPQDRAVGYREGDLRGALWASLAR